MSWQKSFGQGLHAEKKEGEDNEAYYLRNLEEIKKKKATDNSVPALIVQEYVAENEFGGVEVWSTDSENDEVQRPTNGRAFVAKEESSGLREGV